MNQTLVVLAAGMGSRYGGFKQVDGFGPNQEALVEYTIYDAYKVGFTKVVLIVRLELEDYFKSLAEKFSGLSFELVYQDLTVPFKGIELPKMRTKPLGTGHAMLITKNIVTDPFVIVNADDYYGRDALAKAYNFLSQSESDEYCLVGYPLNKTLSDHGTVSRGVCTLDAESNLETIREKEGIVKKGDAVFYQENDRWLELNQNPLVSMNLWGAHPTVFSFAEKHFEIFIKNNHKNLKSEFYLPYIFNQAIQEHYASVKVLETTSNWFGVTYTQDKEPVIQAIQDMVNNGLYPQKISC